MAPDVRGLTFRAQQVPNKTEVSSFVEAEMSVILFLVMKEMVQMTIANLIIIP